MAITAKLLSPRQPGWLELGKPRGFASCLHRQFAMIDGVFRAVTLYHYLQRLYITHMGDVLFFCRDNTLLNGLDCTLSAVFNLQFIIYMFQVGFKGVTAHGKRSCYGIIFMTCNYQIEDLFFPAAQVDFRMIGRGLQIL